jgi:hypothetical protein
MASCIDGQEHLPTNVQLYINQKQLSNSWRNNAYRTNGKLKKNAFQLAFNINCANNDKTFKSCITLADLQNEINTQTPALWIANPWKHYDIKSTVFTLTELRAYVHKRESQNDIQGMPVA